MNRREFLRKSAAAGAGFAVSSAFRLPSALASGQGQPLSGQGGDPDSIFHCKWGAFALPRSGQKATDALVALEQKVGRRFAVHRDYQGMDVDIVDPQLVWLGNRGTIPYRAFHASTTHKSNIIRWADINAGHYDAWLRRQAQMIGNWGKPIYLCFHHEPEVWPQCGSPSDFRNAWNHVQVLFQGVTNVTWVLTLMSPTFYGNNYGAHAWLPYVGNYDVLGVDGYNRYPCRGYSFTSFTYKFQAAKTYAQYHGNKQLLIGEAGCVELNSCGYPGDPGGKARWIYEMQRVIKTWPRVIAVCWSHVASGPYAFWVDTSSASLAAYRQVGFDPYFR